MDQLRAHLRVRSLQGDVGAGRVAAKLVNDDAFKRVQARAIAAMLPRGGGDGADFEPVPGGFDGACVISRGAQHTCDTRAAYCRHDTCVFEDSADRPASSLVFACALARCDHPPRVACHALCSSALAVLGCDQIISESGDFYFIECNKNPGTSTRFQSPFHERCTAGMMDVLARLGEKGAVSRPGAGRGELAGTNNGSLAPIVDGDWFYPGTFECDRASAGASE